VRERTGIDVLLSVYHQLGGRIAQHEVDIAGLRHEQALLIGRMHQEGVSYRALAPLLGISKSRVEQLDQTALRTRTKRRVD